MELMFYMKNNVALVLVTFNRSNLLEEMLNSVIQQTVLPEIIYVIDNNSNDNTSSVVLNFSEKYKHIISVVYHNTGANLGGAGGFEFGSRLAFEAGYEWIWLADDDVELAPDCLNNLLLFKEEADILQPMRVNMDGSCAEISGTDYEINSLTRLNPKQNTVQDIKSRDWKYVDIKTIPFEGPLIHRKVFEKIGFPDPRFFIFYDDLDFALRAQNAGYKIICVRQAIMKRKILFVQSRALLGWKGYFMYRNFFYVQLIHGRKTIAYLRIFMIFILVSIHSLITGKAKSIPVLIEAFKHALNADFSANEKYKP